eukprot:653156-Amphidinium_carterae.1
MGQLFLEVAREVGFRESGLSLGRRRVMVQIRTLATRLEIPLAVNNGLIVDFLYFETIMKLANSRMVENQRRIKRLWQRLQAEFPQMAVEAACSELSIRRPWVVACPPSLAKRFKVAIEEHGWMDDTRKMARVALPMDMRKTDDHIAIPLITTAADLVIDSVSEATTAAVVAEKAGAALAEFLDLEDVSQPVFVFESSGLPTKTATESARSGVSSGASGVLARLVAEVHSLVLTSLPEQELHAFPPVHTFYTDVRAVGKMQWRGDVALLPRNSLCGKHWDTLVDKVDAVQNAHGVLWERIRQAFNARLLARQQEIRVDDE